jgi:hypothetical protein
MTFDDWSNYLQYRECIIQNLDPEWYPPEWLDAAIAQGAVVGFYGDKSALLCEVRQYPGGARVGGVFHAVGVREELEDLLRPEAEAWAHSVGCSHIVLEGRLGWVRSLKSVGYEPHKASVIKAL